MNPLTRLLQVRTTEDMEDESLRNHVIIAGYGLTGRSLARSLAQIGTSYIIVDLNTENVRHAALRGEPACFGDVTSAEVLGHLGAAKASDLVIAINDTDATVRATRVVRRAAPDLRITVRTTYEADVKRLEEAGATYVIAAETAAADVITDHVLRMLDGSPEEQSERSRPSADGDGNQGTE